ncbi:MAG: MFS transporter [Pseudomonadota bacterium]
MNPILSRYPALGSPRYRRYWLGSFASVGATQLVTMGQGWVVYELSESAFMLGLLGFAASVPNILMTLFGGVIADRFDKRRILMATSSSTAIALAALTLLDATGQIAVWHVLVIAAFNSAITGLDWPTRSALFPLLVERPAYLSAVALNMFIWQSTRMALPALGGVILLVADSWVVFALGATGFFTMFLVLSSLSVAHSAAEKRSALDEIREGLAFIFASPLFLSLMLLSFSVSFFSTCYVQILPVFADLLGRGEAAYGTLLSAGGVGSVLGTLIIGGGKDRPRLGMLMLSSACASGVLLMAFAVAASNGFYLASLALATAAALFSSCFMVLAMSVLQLLVPDSLRGRVMGLYTMGFALVPLGGLMLGSISEASSAVLALVISNLLMIVLFTLLGFRQRQIRGLSSDALTATMTAEDSLEEDEARASAG